MKHTFDVRLLTLIAMIVSCLSAGSPAFAQVLPTPLADSPLYTINNVPANLMLMLSVEFPTANVAAYTDAKIDQFYTDSTNTVRKLYCNGYNSAGYGDCYSPTMNYLGYFDYTKCYTYTLTNGPSDTTSGYFTPVNSGGPVCGPNYWSGNMLNWASMTALDEFRKTLSGGYRVVTTDSTAPAIDINGDTVGLTVLERARRSSQGSSGNFRTKQIGSGNPTCTTPAGMGYSGCAAATMAPSTVIGDPAFKNAANVYIRSVNGGTELSYGSDRGVFMEIADNSCFVKGNTSCGGVSRTYNDKLYYVRVEVCVPGMLESNCNSAHAKSDYPGAGSYNKPEGLIQQNYTRIRVGATGYLVAYGAGHPNGVVRALLRDNGPTQYNGSGPRTSNPNAEWDKTTGIFTSNPDPDEVTASIPCGSSSGCVAPGDSTSGASSGTINYLNQFGLSEPGYETQDTIADLYWATLAYYKKLPLDPSYTQDNNQIQLDGFPAMANPSAISGPGADPMQYTCQGNSIVTIGDTHTWCDTRVPGSYLNAGGSCSNQAPLAAIAPTGSDITGLNDTDWVNAIGKLPLVEPATGSNTFDAYAGIANLASQYEFNDPPGATYNMAGMAYYAHTQNIRPDLRDSTGYPDNAPNPQPANWGAPITIDTYSVDVMEPGSYDGSASNPTFNPGGINSGNKLTSGGGPNNYWLADKYGGFEVDPEQCALNPTQCVTINGTLVPTPESVLDWHTNTTTVSGPNMRPDNYFPGNRPDLIQAGLTTIFNQVASKTPFSTAAPGIASSRILNAATAVYNPPVAGDVAIYQTQYIPGRWTGDVIGMLDSVLPTGATTQAYHWNAKTQLDNVANGIPARGVNPAVPPSWSTGRRIVTWNGSKGVPFRYANLSAAEQNDFPGDTSIASPLLNFLRGDRSNEGTLFHIRTHVLGDITESGVALVQGGLSSAYTDANNPGYSAFTTSVANRMPVVYVGSNDGMLHAFQADFSKPTSTAPLAGGGSELFAYVPSLLIAGPSSPATPTQDGLAALANLNGVTANNYAHHFYVDATPQVADADFDWTCPTPGTACSAGALPNWHTVLVGGLNKGGKGIYALDITTVPPALDSSSSSTQEVAIANKVLWEFTDPDMGYSFGRPVVAKTRKYGWVVLVTSGYDNSSGLGHLYVLNIKTGTLLEKLNTTDGTSSNPSGLGSPSPYTEDSTDGTIEQVYAGNLLGNVWRFDLSGTGVYPSPTLIATLTDASGNHQPITTAPRIENDVDSTGLGTRRWVFVGTGRFLDAADLPNTAQQTMYALRDGTATSFSTAGLPLTRSVLQADTNLTTGINIPDSSPGWYYDLPGVSPAGATERITFDPDAVSGVPIIAWATYLPTKDPCQPAGYQYAVNYGSGKSVLLNSGAAIASLYFQHGITSSEIVQLPGAAGAPPVYAILGQPVQGNPTLTLLNGSGIGATVGRTNWREILN